MDDFRARVAAYYRAHNPERIGAVDEIVAKYAGREEILWQKLHKKYRDRFDFRSKQFDPLEALRDAHVRPPVPDAQPLDNLSKFRDLLPRSSDAYDGRVKRGAHHTAEAPAAPSSRGAELLHCITDPMRRGPFSLLWRALQDRRRLRVKVRARDSIRGHCVGLLKAFDRHMNLVLADANEQYAPKRRIRSPVSLSRSIKQLFIRGDSIVLVCFADAR